MKCTPRMYLDILYDLSFLFCHMYFYENRKCFNEFAEIKETTLLFRMWFISLVFVFQAYLSAI